VNETSQLVRVAILAQKNVRSPLVGRDILIELFIASPQVDRHGFIAHSIDPKTEALERGRAAHPRRTVQRRRLEQYAAALAARHTLAGKPRRLNLLLPRLEENGRKLLAAYKALAESIREEHVISPAAEWLVDNFHIVEEQVREIREDLPKSYYYELPQLAEGDFKNYPRIYALSIALIGTLTAIWTRKHYAALSTLIRKFPNSRLANCGRFLSACGCPG